MARVRNVDDTQTGGAPRAFPTTRWSRLPGSVSVPSGVRERRLEELSQRYWKPAYCYVRSAFRTDVEEAKDLTQSFFAMLLEQDPWSRLAPERGSFRAWLKTALYHFVLNARRPRDAARRAGTRVLSLDLSDDDLAALEPASHETPELSYDRAWFRCVMDEAVIRLRKSLEGRGDATSFEVFRAYCLEPVPGERPTYASVASRLGMKSGDVRNRLFTLRRTLRRLVREQILEYVGDEDAVDAELREAMGR